ncbi:DNA replication factor Dna2-domain-containing protein, partial [Ostreococcus tauri]
MRSRRRRTRAMADDDAPVSSQRERVTYAAASTGSTTARDAGARAGEAEDEAAMEARGRARDGWARNEALRRLFRAGDVGGGDESAGGDGARGNESELATWLHGNDGGDGKRAKRRDSKDEPARPSLPIGSPEDWDGDGGAKSREGRRYSRRGATGRRSEDVLEELLMNLDKERARGHEEAAPSAIETAVARAAKHEETKTTSRENLAPDVAWGSDNEDDSQALLDAVTLVEKAKACSAQTTQASKEPAIASEGTLIDDDDDDEDLYAAVTEAERVIEQRNASVPTSPRRSPRQTTQVKTEVKTESKTEVKVEHIDEVYDDGDIEFLRAIELELEVARRETEILGTWMIKHFESCRPGLVDSLDLHRPNGEAKKVLLKGAWRETPVSEGDSVSLYGLDETARELAGKDVVEITEGSPIMLILFPAYLISATTIGGSFTCLRQTVLQQQVQQTWGDASEAATVGTIMHELAEKAILSAAGRNPEPMEVTVERMIKSSTNAIFEIDYSEQKLKQRIDNTIPGVQRWAHKLAALSRVTKLPRATPDTNALVRMNRKAAIDKLRNKCTVGVEVPDKGTVQVDEVVDIEELIWAPKLGLKGILDGVASAVVRERNTDLPKPSVVPLELKTGKWRDCGHNAQVQLYNLMIGERYGTVSPFGVLHYTNSDHDPEGESKLVPLSAKDLGLLILQRNKLAVSLRPTPEAAVKRDVPIAPHGKARLGNGQLPEMTPQGWCERCFARDDCFTLHRALEGGNSGTSELGDLFETCTSHLNKKYDDTLRHWLHLIDLESSELLRKRATPWLPVELVNQRDGFAVSEISFVREVTDDLSKGDDLYYYMFRPSPNTPRSIVKRIAIRDRVVLSTNNGAT